MTQKCETKLLGHPGSAFTTRAKWVMKLKSMDYEWIEQDLIDKSELLLRSNPGFQQVPVLVQENEPPICESLVIMEYLDEIKPDLHPILPSSPLDRSQCRMVANYFDTLCYPWMKEFMLTPDEDRREELKKMIIEASVMLEQIFMKFSKGKAFFGGDDIGYLDIVVGSFLGWVNFLAINLNFNVIEEARNPRLTEWGKCMWANEVAKDVIPSYELHLDFYNMLQIHPKLAQWVRRM